MCDILSRHRGPTISAPVKVNDAGQHCGVANQGGPQPVIGPGFDVFRAEAPAVHIQAHPDPVDQDGHENHQQRGDDGKRSADVRHQTDGGDHLEQRQPDATGISSASGTIP